VTASTEKAYYNVLLSTESMYRPPNWKQRHIGSSTGSRFGLAVENPDPVQVRVSKKAA
jgi:hypothetical protein